MSDASNNAASALSPEPGSGSSSSNPVAQTPNGEGIEENKPNTKLFVGQIPPDTTEETIRSVFNSYGTITSFFMMRDRLSNRSKGCCFITFTSPQSCVAAIEALHEKYSFPNAKRTVIVKFAGEDEKEKKKEQEKEPNEWKLYVGMLSRATTEPEVYNLFSQYGRVLEFCLLVNKVTGQSKGHGFVKFEKKEEAINAINALNDRYRDKQAPGPLQVRFAHTRDERSAHIQAYRQSQLSHHHHHHHQHGRYHPHQHHHHQHHNFAAHNPYNMNAYGISLPFHGAVYGNYNAGANNNNNAGAFYGQNAPHAHTPGNFAKGPEGANLFVMHLPENFGDVELHSLFLNYGNIVSAKVQIDRNGRSKGFGFVSFDNTKSAQAAISAMDGYSLGAKRLIVKVKKGENGTSGNPSAPNTNNNGFNTALSASFGGLSLGGNSYASVFHSAPGGPASGVNNGAGAGANVANQKGANNLQPYRHY